MLTLESFSIQLSYPVVDLYILPQKNEYSSFL